MRYVRLMFLGMVLWAGPASAEMVPLEMAKQVLIEGKTIGEFYKKVGDALYRESRVIHDGSIYICKDWLSVLGSVRDLYVSVRCWNDTGAL